MKHSTKRNLLILAAVLILIAKGFFLTGCSHKTVRDDTENYPPVVTEPAVTETKDADGSDAQPAAKGDENLLNSPLPENGNSGDENSVLLGSDDDGKSDENDFEVKGFKADNKDVDAPANTAKGSDDADSIPDSLKEAAKAAILKAMPAKKDLEIKSLTHTKDWALVRMTSPFEGKTYHESVLLKKKGSGFEFKDITGSGPTIDFLGMSKVPPEEFDDLLGIENMAKQAPILEALRRENPKTFFVNLNIAGDWAMAIWLEDPAGGMALVKKMGAKWVSVAVDGGVMDDDSIKEYGVPADVLSKLKGVE